jgi:cell fate regulator YaaT (PSP1 superfamily)
MLPYIERVSVKMAKQQSIALNPERISGLCGRLMCCLAFEFDSYVDMKKDMPKCGKRIQTQEGHAKVIRQNALKGEIAVELEDGKEISINIKDL